MKVIAIDGPAGSGKSTVARAVAARLGLRYLDTGAMYRAVAHAATARGLAPSDAAAIGTLARSLDLTVSEDEVRVDGAEVTTAIRSREVTATVSAVAANPEVRAAMRDRQRAWAAAHGGGVMEGRDIGTVVFPDAALKVYLTASPEVRASRRAAEMGLSADEVAGIAEDIRRRDEADASRAHDPLRTADDAVVVDTSDRSIDDVVDEIVRRLP